MELIPTFLHEIEQEAQTTRKMLQRIPDDKYELIPGRVVVHLRNSVKRMCL